MQKQYDFTNVKRNYNRVEDEELRRKVDIKWTTLHDELSDCYYNFWKNGLSKQFQGYDVQSTVEESKALFDNLHGLVEDNRIIALDDENKKLPKGKRKKFNNIDVIREKVLILTSEGISII